MRFASWRKMDSGESRSGGGAGRGEEWEVLLGDVFKSCRYRGGRCRSDDSATGE